MKYLVCLLVILPVIMAVNLNERFLFDLNKVKNALLAALGSDFTHDACVAACPSILSAAGLGSLSFLCSAGCSAVGK